MPDISSKNSYRVSKWCHISQPGLLLSDPITVTHLIIGKHSAEQDLEKIMKRFHQTSLLRFTTKKTHRENGNVKQYFCSLL